VSDNTALVVEDDPDISALLEQTLTLAGFAVVTAADGRQAVEVARRIDPALITLDLNLPSMDGVEVCRQVRDHSDCYIIMLTARHEEIDRLIGLEVGADDYMVKPFSPRELRARVAALFRRPRTGADAASESGGNGRADIDGGAGLVISPSRREVVHDGTLVELTRTEFDLLALLAADAGTVRSRAEIVEAIWDTSFSDDQHLIDVHIANLRRKLRAHDNHAWIHTVRGVGYRFDRP
jgi:DNA-binding response OmpR family regulator